MPYCKRAFAVVIVALAACSSDDGQGGGTEGDGTGTTAGGGDDDGPGDGGGPSTGGDADGGSTADATADSGSGEVGSSGGDGTGTDDGSTDGGSTDGGSTDDGATTGGAAGPIDFQWMYSTLMGGDAFDRAQGIFVDGDGYVYLAGNAHSSNFPTTAGAFDQTHNGPSGNGNDTGDGFVAKFAPDGALVWSTLLGGSARDQAYQVRVDDDGYVYTVGSTGSNDFLSEAPGGTPGYDHTFNGPTQANGYGDIFVVKLSPDGDQVIYWTYVGGTGEDTSRGNLSVAADGSVYVSGRTTSSNFPIPAAVPAAFQPNKGAAEDVIVFHLSADGQTLEHATYLGGNSNEMGYGGLFLDPDGDVIVAGSTTSTNFPGTAAGSYHGGDGGAWSFGDGFVAELSPDLSALHWALYVGGSGNDSVQHNQGMAVDLQGRPVLLMTTDTDDLTTTNGSAYSGGGDVYVAVVAADGSGVEAATYVGGSANDYPSGLTVDALGYVYFGGQTSSGDYPTTTSAIGTTLQGAHDVMLTVLAPDLTTVYSTLVEAPPSGAEDQRGRGIWVGPDGVVHHSGVVTPTFPTTADAYQSTPGGGADAFFVSFSPLYE